MEAENQFWFRCWALMAAVIVALIGGVVVCYVVQDRIDANAPVVESCVKHPATRSPFRGNQ